MPDEQVIKLLEEIRDLHKQGLENQNIAIANQQRSIERQKLAVENQKKAMKRAQTTLFIVIGLFLIMFGVPIAWWAISWIVRLATFGH